MPLCLCVCVSAEFAARITNSNCEQIVSTATLFIYII